MSADETAPGRTILVSGVSRAFGQVVALNDVSFELRPGIVGLLGPNGAGKSTLLKILTGELRPTLGEVRVLGLEPFANPGLFRRIAVAPEQEALFEDVTGREFLTFMLTLRGHEPADAAKRAAEQLDAMGLADAMDRRIGGYSKGMRQRCKLAAVLSADAEVLFLDEPLTGLDPLWRHRIQTMIRQRAESGVTVVFSSHVLHEVEQATRQILLLHRGRLAAQGEAREIRALVDKHPHRIHLECVRSRDLGARLLRWDSVESVKVTERGLLVTTPRPDRFYAELTAAAAAEDLGVSGLHSPDDSLAALFETLVHG